MERANAQGAWRHRDMLLRMAFRSSAPEGRRATCALGGVTWKRGLAGSIDWSDMTPMPIECGLNSQPLVRFDTPFQRFFTATRAISNAFLLKCS
jgi:hypothetical protein